MVFPLDLPQKSDFYHLINENAYRGFGLNRASKNLSNKNYYDPINHCINIIKNNGKIHSINVENIYRKRYGSRFSFSLWVHSFSRRKHEQRMKDPKYAEAFIARVEAFAKQLDMQAQNLSSNEELTAKPSSNLSSNSSGTCSEDLIKSEIPSFNSPFSKDKQARSSFRQSMGNASPINAGPRSNRNYFINDG